MPKKHRIALTNQERTQLSEVADAAAGSKERRRRANMLLMADESDQGAAMTDEAIAKALRCRANTVARLRKICYQQGVEAALERAPSSRVQETKLDGRAEAQLIEIACGPAPEGYARWSLRMLADRLVELEIVDEISHTTVAQTLKKNDVKPHIVESWCKPRGCQASFVANMEEILDLYHLPPDPKRPLVCMDEVCVQFLAHVDAPLPTLPGSVAKEDYEYIRNGSGSVFLAIAPHEATRLTFVSKGATRTACDYAEFLRQISEAFPEAEEILLVQDNLNTHSTSSLYKAFEPKDARDLAKRFSMHQTPTHGSWLNIAESEISVLSRQCMSRRIADETQLRSEVKAWTKKRNEVAKTINWQFTTDDARVKLKSFYPTF